MIEFLEMAILAVAVTVFAYGALVICVIVFNLGKFV